MSGLDNSISSAASERELFQKVGPSDERGTILLTEVSLVMGDRRARRKFHEETFVH